MGQQKPPGGEELLSKVLKEEEKASHSLLRERNHKNFIQRKRMAGVEVNVVGRGEVVLQGLGLRGPLSSLKLVGTNFQIIKPSRYFFPLNPKAQVSLTNSALSANGTVSYSSSELQQNKEFNG